MKKYSNKCLLISAVVLSAFVILITCSYLCVKQSFKDIRTTIENSKNTFENAKVCNEEKKTIVENSKATLKSYCILSDEQYVTAVQDDFFAFTVYKNLKNQTNVENISECLPDGAMDTGIESYVALIPSNIMQLFYESGWHYEIYFEDALKSKFGMSVDVMGVTDWAEKTIWIDRRKSSYYSIIHEIGHWYSNYKMGWEYYNPLWKEYMPIRDAEWEVLYKTFGGSKANYYTYDECIAESFSIYILQKDKLSVVAPLTYAFMEKIVNEY